MILFTLWLLSRTSIVVVNELSGCYTLLMAKRKTKKVTAKSSNDFDGEFLLKLTLYVILGSLWVKITKEGTDLSLPIPIGLIIGLFFATHEHFKIDRKIEYAVLVVAALFGFLAPFGLYIQLG